MENQKGKRQNFIGSEKVKSNSENIPNGLIQMSEQPANMATIQLNGDRQNFIIDKKDFKTGSRGYYGTGKMVAAGKKYQISIQVVEIGSKPKEEEKKK
jgi:hypothetical protein